MPYSPAIKAGDWVFIAGQIASDFDTGIAPEVKRAPAKQSLRPRRIGTAESLCAKQSCEYHCCYGLRYPL